jgi:hypothetical protein
MREAAGRASVIMSSLEPFPKLRAAIAECLAQERAALAVYRGV